MPTPVTGILCYSCSMQCARAMKPFQAGNDCTDHKRIPAVLWEQMQAEPGAQHNSSLNTEQGPVGDIRQPARAGFSRTMWRSGTSGSRT